MRTIFLLLLLIGFETNVLATPSSHHFIAPLLYHVKLDTIPIVTCPNDLIVSCEQFDPSLNAYGQPTVSGISCLDTILSLVNYAQFDSICSRGTIKRTFIAFDCAGDLNSCVQRLVVNYAQDYYIHFPNDVYVTNCDDYGQPTFFGTNCELLGISYEDEVPAIITDACYLLERSWTIINWCTYNPSLPLTYVPNPRPSAIMADPSNLPGPIVSACGTAAPWAPTLSKLYPLDTVKTNFCSFWNANANGYRYTQIIKIIDTEQPVVLNCPDSSVTFVDATGNDHNYWNNIFNPALPAQDLGEMEINLSLDVTDGCSKSSVHVGFLLFLDLDADGVVETVVNSLHYPPQDSVYYGNFQSPNYMGGTARAFDNRPVPANQKWRFAIQRFLVGDSLRSAVRWNTAQSPNTYVVPQLPLGTHKIKWLVQDGCGNENFCENTFTIQASSLGCTPPADVVVSCENFDPSLLAYGEAAFSSLCPLESATESANYAQFDTICRRGTITRIFNALDSCGNASQCSQQVVVNYKQDYYIKFPDDTLTTVCNSTHVYGQPVFFGEDCELMGVSYEDEVFPLILPDACFRINRTWSVINWCTYNPNLPLTDVPNPTLVLTTYHNPLNAPGPIVSACGAAPPWAPTVSKINPGDPTATNFCTFWSASANGYRYRQYVKIADSTPPIILNCPDSSLTFVDNAGNNPDYWNNVFNPNLPTQDLRETPIDLNVTLTDECSGANVNIEYLLFLDLDADGQQETVINSIHVGLAGLGWDNVLYNNINTPNFNGGTPTSFDDRPVLVNQKWGFAISETIVGNNKTASVRWNTAQSPNTYVVPELPVGTHKIKWIVQDGCGYESVCEHNFTIQASSFDCSPPADVVVSCENFDPSLLTYGEANFSGLCPVQSAVKSANYSQFDSLCSRGTIVRIFSALDSCGNASQCSQQVMVNYKQDYYIKFPDDVITTNCNGTGIYGEPTFLKKGCELLSVAFIDETIDPIPSSCYKIERVWSVINWCTYDPTLPFIYVPNPNPHAISNHVSNLPGPTVSACGTPIPWASTLVKISPTDPAATDYCTFWNANANGYSYKQIIRINDSTDPTFDSCPTTEAYFIDDSPNDPALWNNVFDPNAPANDLREGEAALSITTTDACSGSNVNIEYLLFLDLDADGQMETVVNSTSFGPSGLGWNNVLYNNINTPGFLGGTPTSFDNRAVPTAQKWGFSILESVLGSSRTASVRWNSALSPFTQVVPELPNGRHKVRWIVFDACGNEAVCEQAFSIGDTTLVGTETPVANGFALFQNEPNPFSNSTIVRFQLPESTTATLSVFDAEGRVLYCQTADYGQGMHMVVFEKDQLASSGVLFYKLEAGAHAAWRKMVLLR